VKVADTNHQKGMSWKSSSNHLNMLKRGDKIRDKSATICVTLMEFSL